MDTAPRLACQQCKQRKLRCDKGAPCCSACRNAGLSCVTIQRARLPRGKSGKVRKHKQTLESRVKTLEGLLEQRNNICTPSAGYKHVPSGPVHGDHFLAHDFWSALSDSVTGLREMLDGSEDEHEVDPPSTAQMFEGSDMSSTLLFPTSTLHVQHSPLFPHDVSKALFALYRDRVDNVYKVFHWPTTVALLETNHGDMGPTTPTQALKHAVYFMATCTMTDDESLSLGFGARTELLDLCRSAAETWLMRSSLLQHPDLISLQAFVVYLIGLRTCLNSATTWTLVAVAVRIATALGLGNEDDERFTSFDLELRRRLLYTIGVLDTHAALDRGTVPILPAIAFRTPPLDINDCDLSPEGGVIFSYSAEVTDMTHSMMTYEAMLCQRKIYELSQCSGGGLSEWPERLQLVAGFGLYVDQVWDRIRSPSTPLHILLRISGRKIHSSLELLLRRPPYRQPHTTVPLSDNFDIMLAATDVLEHHLQVPLPELQPWSWKNWIQWHALAVLLVELLVRPSEPLSDRAYAVAASAFRCYATIVADSQSGMLWKPISKLMRKVQHMRQDPTSSAILELSGTDCAWNGGAKVLASSLFINDNLNGFTIAGFDDQLPSCFQAVDCGTTDSALDTQPWSEWDLFLQDVTCNGP